MSGSKQQSTMDPASRACLRFGWTALAAFMLLGLGLEALHLIKAPLYLEAHLRRDLWTLGHAHGVLLGLANVVFALASHHAIPDPARRVAPARALRAAGLLLPLGFLLGGIGNAEGDPSLFILLAPAGALCAIYAAARTARAAYRG